MKSRKNFRHFSGCFWAFALSSILSGTQVASAQTLGEETLGMVVDPSTSRVIVFDADSDVAIGSVHLPTGPASSHECVISSDQKLAFVNDFSQMAIWVIDLTTLDLDGGLNPIHVSLAPLDLTISANQSHLIASGGGHSTGISVVNTVDRSEVDSYQGPQIQSVEICDDMSVLATSTASDETIRFDLDASGHLAMRDSMSLVNAFNTGCSTESTGFAVNALSDHRVSAVSYPPLHETQAVHTSSSPVSLAMARNGESVYVRATGSGGLGSIERFDVMAWTGQLAPTPTLQIPTFGTSLYYGVEQLAIHPDNTKIYVPEGNALRVFDSSRGKLLASIEHPDLQDAVGVCLPAPPTDSLLGIWNLKRCSDSNTFDCKRNRGVVQTTVYGSATLDVDQLDFSTLRLALASDTSRTTGPPEIVSTPLDFGSPQDLNASSCDFNPKTGEESGTPDGLLDVEVKFSAAELAELIGCDGLGKGDASADLVLIGAYFDGTPFITENTQFVVNTAK